MGGHAPVGGPLDTGPPVHPSAGPRLHRRYDGRSRAFCVHA